MKKEPAWQEPLEWASLGALVMTVIFVFII